MDKHSCITYILSEFDDSSSDDIPVTFPENKVVGSIVS